jgi:serine/threonine protein kinase
VVEFQGDPPLNTLIFPYAAGGDLLEYVLANGPLKQRELRIVAKALFGALEHTHSKGYVHGDVKLDNTVIHGSLANGDLWLCDFGAAGKPGPFSEDRVTTLEYCAPEVQRLKLYTEKSDLFSAGVMLFACFTKQHLYPRGWKPISSGCIAAALKNLCPEGRALIISLLETDPDMRPSASEALNHKFLTQVDEIPYHSESLAFDIST